MRVAEADLLIVPGLGGSGPDHWQTRWEQKLSTARRVHQSDWHQPKLAHWTEALTKAVADAQRPVVLIGHSLGVHAIAHAARHFDPGKVRGAFLVTPPSTRNLASLPGVDAAFGDIDHQPLPFPSVLVASRNDPFGSLADSETLAKLWAAQLIDAGDSGHINADSGHGPWPEGLMRLGGFLAKIQA